MRATAQWLRERAVTLGFSGVGIAAAAAPGGLSLLEEWMRRGYHGEMEYFPKRRKAYAHPASVLEGVRTLVMLTLDYAAVGETPVRGEGRGRVARYAQGSVDYHDVIHEKLDLLRGELASRHPEAAFRGVVDTAPLLEREFAELAGLGWRGKNTLLLRPQRGSYFFLACLLTSLDLPIDAAFTADHCGVCTACLDACPTGAFVGPRLLDARKCISYLTIELRSPIPGELREGIGDWLFGCDVCQEVCPWNRFAPPAQEPAFQPLGDGRLDAAEILEMDEAAFRARFRKTPLWRPKRRGILRNAAIVLGNTAGALSERQRTALVRGLGDVEPLVRGACAWALGRKGEAAALRERLKVEEDEEVRKEIEGALRSLDAAGEDKE